jgi:uncharacterized membrane protein YhaH (DUF805 family)
MDWKYLYASREGRIGRRIWWLATAIMVAVSIAIQLLLGPVIGLIGVVIVTLPLLYASYALNVKRGHDRNRPDWYVGLYFVLVLLLNIGQMTATDPLNPGSLATGAFWSLALWSIVMLVDFGFLRGTEGPNQYGQDPLAT